MQKSDLSSIINGRFLLPTVTQKDFFHFTNVKHQQCKIRLKIVRKKFKLRTKTKDERTLDK